MRHVDHDPVAARHAAAVCRDVAWGHRGTAGRLEVEPGVVAWWGRERDDVVTAAGELARELRAEASSLDVTADLLEAAARAAERREADLTARAQAEVEAAVAVPCPPARGHPTVSAGGSSERPARRSSTAGGEVR